MGHELAVVMPVYNEEACIAQVVESWLNVLTDLQVNFLMIVLDDGSTDATAKTLDRFADDTRVCIVHQANAGHGPTILRGYRQAANVADWVFQCDSDNEMSPESFSLLWEQRSDYNAVFGYRRGRQQSRGRSLVSWCSRLTVRLLFGSGVRDVNTPYRLMRSTVLYPIIERVPADTFAPNILISGAIARAGVPIVNIPVPCRPRQSGCSINTWKLGKGAIRSFAQTWRYRKQVASAVRASQQNDASCERPNPAAAHGETPNGSLSS
jgi:glycosyltransferase involved in cell wall biosynthesis